MEQKISVIIQTYNAAEHLQRVIDCAKMFDEVVICDMESTDDTVAIAEQNGCRVVVFEKKDYTICEPYRDASVHCATYPWVLVLDADELVTPQLRDYLYEQIAREDCPAGFYLPRRNYFMGRFMHCHYPNHILRFMRRDLTTWPPQIHSVPKIDGKTVKLPRGRREFAIEHLANETVSDLIRKADRYTTEELERRKHKHYGVMAFFTRPTVRFCKYYFQKQGFLDGIPGLIRALMNAYYQVVFLAKYQEQKRKK